MLRQVAGLGRVLTFMLTCVASTCYVTSLGWGCVYVHVYNVNLCHMHMLRVGEGLSVHVNLRLMHMLRHVTGLVGC